MKKKRLGIFPNLGKENVCIALPEFIQLCKDWGLEPVLPVDVAQQYGVSSYNKSEPQTLKTLDYGVSLGGDGTLLQMARTLHRSMCLPSVSTSASWDFWQRLTCRVCIRLSAVWHKATIRWKPQSAAGQSYLRR